MRWLRTLLVTLCLGLSASALGATLPPQALSTARADHDIDTPFTGTRPLQLDLHAGFTWYGLGFAGGARFGIPILQNGFIPSLDNAVYLNFGVDAYAIDWSGCRSRIGTGCNREYGFALGFPITLHWEFYFTDNWSAFAELGFQIFLPPSLFYGDYWDPGDHIGMWVIAAAGGSYHFSEAIAITLRLGNPYFSFGVTFQF
jgi:hypothetical protein